MGGWVGGMALEVGDFWNEAFVGTLINVKSWGGGGEGAGDHEI